MYQDKHEAPRYLCCLSKDPTKKLWQTNLLFMASEIAGWVGDIKRRRDSYLFGFAYGRKFKIILLNDTSKEFNFKNFQ